METRHLFGRAVITNDEVEITDGNIIDILDDGDSFVIIMDFIEGNSLQHYLKH